MAVFLHFQIVEPVDIVFRVHGKVMQSHTSLSVVDIVAVDIAVKSEVKGVVFPFVGQSQSRRTHIACLYRELRLRL